MTYGLSLPGNGTNFFIDQNFPGMFLGTNSYKYIPPDPAGGIDGYGFKWLNIHHPSIGYEEGDMLFLQPSDLTSIFRPRRMAAIFERDNIPAPMHVHLYKNLSNSPQPATGYGLIVWTADGRQAFNSSAHHKKIDIAFSGITPSRPVGGKRDPVVFSPSDSITNYYCLATTAQVRYMEIQEGLPPTSVFALAGTSYEYDTSNNTIRFIPDDDDSGRVGSLGGNNGPIYYCIARILG